MSRPRRTSALLALTGWSLACGSERAPASAAAPTAAGEPSGEAAGAAGSPALNLTASVDAVSVSGGESEYTFAVTISSPDEGCHQYADFWEVISLTGELIYRRVLLHSHVAEQPFTRTGGPVTVSPAEIVIVRAHMNPGGYGTEVQRGSAATGFESAAAEPGFALQLATLPPLPDSCAF